MATKWGICGAGKISHDFVVAMRTLSPGVMAVAARKLEDAQQFAKRHGIPKSYGSYEELAEDQEIDVVYLCVGLLFLHARRNVLCEKPFAMNSREVHQLITAARKNNVFLMEGLWSRCFPVYREISRLLMQDIVGEVKMVEELGGGVLLDIGVYCLQFVLMVFKGERPESIQATGVCLDTGVDESMVVVLKFPRNRMAVCGFSISTALPNDATICGTMGTIRIGLPYFRMQLQQLTGNRNFSETEYTLPEPAMPLNFTNSTGLRYEAEEVRQCLLNGLKESSRMTLADSAMLTEIMDEARRQVGVVFEHQVYPDS
uniref:Trans-1,2-dihydrobenzene-1,2-diol dehydrogenase n=1 Tax=Scleropages formosus TaxID=113540 RepID=A0A8D0CK83_SCLFO